MAYNLFRYVKNGNQVCKEGTDECYEVAGKIGRDKIILVPQGKKITADQIVLGKEEFNNNYYYGRDNLTDWSVFSTKQITSRLKCL